MVTIKAVQTEGGDKYTKTVVEFDSDSIFFSLHSPVNFVYNSNDMLRSSSSADERTCRRNNIGSM